MEQKPFEQWAIIELFGHQRIAGKVSEQSIGGCNFVRVDVPALGESISTSYSYGQRQVQPPLLGFTKLYGSGAIYAMTFVTEALARLEAYRLRAVPIAPFDLQEALALQGKTIVASSSLPEHARAEEFEGSDNTPD